VNHIVIENSTGIVSGSHTGVLYQSVVSICWPSSGSSPTSAGVEVQVLIVGVQQSAMKTSVERTSR